MKRCTPYHVLRNKRIARLRSARKKRSLRKSSLSKNIDYQYQYVRSGQELIAPIKFSLARPYAAPIVRFLKAITNSVLSRNKPVVLNFKETKSFHVSAAILLFAELNRIVNLSGVSKPITILEPKSKRTREVLKQIGIYQLTGDKSDTTPTRSDVVFWKATKGENQTGDNLGPILEFVTERANREHVEKVELSGMWRGISEAVANTVDHAYEFPRSDGFAGLSDIKWWMFTQVRDEYFTAAVCDLGCGYERTINLTIPESFRSYWSRIFFGDNHDAISIQTAMEYGRSGTKLSNRGKGSRDALAVLEKHGTGVLSILSNTGWVEYSYKNGSLERNVRGRTGIDIGGTIIQWTLPLKDTSDDNDQHSEGLYSLPNRSPQKEWRNKW